MRHANRHKAPRTLPRTLAALQAGLLLSAASCVGEPEPVCTGANCGAATVPASALLPCAFGQQPSASCQVDRTLGVFLSPKGRDDGDGTVSRPFLTFARAMRDERFKKNGQIFACIGDFSEPVRAADLPRLAILGGFDCSSWAPAAGITRIVTAEQVGLALRRVPVAHLYDLEIRTNDAPAKELGVSRIGLALTDVASASLARLSVHAGAASQGAPGADAAPNPGVSYGAPYEARICADGSWSAGAGAEHESPRIETEVGTSSSRSFVDASPSSGQNNVEISLIGKHKHGYAGANGRAGMATPLSADLGAYDAALSLWKPPTPFFGAAGAPGGGSGQDGASYASNAGTCGGSGGGGGQGGGHSIGVYVENSTVTLRDVRIQSSKAGGGGPGAEGAPGEVYLGATEPFVGGTKHAGPGGGGGGGAGGNGGNGGLSAGICWIKSTATLDGVALTNKDTALWFAGPSVRAPGGSPGLGGVWGYGTNSPYPGSAPSGAAGISGAVQASYTPAK